jgi:hypothetical protein
LERRGDLLDIWKTFEREHVGTPWRSLGYGFDVVKNGQIPED